MKKELFIHVFEGNGFLSFSSYNDAMEALIDCEVPNYLGTFYLYRDPEIKTHDFINMKDLLPKYMEELASEYRHEKYLRSLEATDRV